MRSIGILLAPFGTERGQIAFLWFSLFIWFLWTLWAAPAPLGIDGWIYKGPGCSLAVGDGLTARFLPTYPDDAVRYYAIHTPGLALSFASLASLIGCSPRTDSVLDLVLSAAPILMLAPCFLRLLRGEPKWFAGAVALLLAVSLPMGLTIFQKARSEALAVALFTAAIVLLKEKPAKNWLSFVLAGVVAFVSPAGGVAAGLLIFFLSLVRQQVVITIRLLFFQGLKAFAWYILPLILWGVASSVVDPHWYQQFLAHSYSPGIGPGTFLLAESRVKFYTDLLEGFFLDNFFGTVAHIATLLPFPLAFALFCQMDLLKRSNLLLHFGLTVAFVIVLPYQPSYLFMLAAFLSCAAISVLVTQNASRVATRLATAMFIIPLIGNLPYLTVSVLGRSQSIESYDEIVEQAPAFVEAALGQSPNGYIMVPATHFLLFRALTDRVVVDHYWQNYLNDSLVGLASCAASRRADTAGTPHGPAGDLSWVPWGEDSLSKVPATLFGHPIANILANWSCRFYLRAPGS